MDAEFPMLTTVDNPYSPFTQFDKWFAFDIQKGYNSCGLLARIAQTSDAMSDAEQAQEISEAIDFIVQHDPLGVYIRARKPNDVALTN